MRHFLIYLSVIFLAACTVTAPPPVENAEVRAEKVEQAKFIVKNYRTEEQRMLDVWWKIAIANNDLCPKKDIFGHPGFRLSNREIFRGNDLFNKNAFGFVGRDWIKLYDNVYGSSPDWLTIAHIYKDSPAAKAGLQAKDRILTVDGQSFRNSTRGRRQLNRYLEGLSGEDGRITLRVSRGDTSARPQEFDITLAAQPVCFFPVFLVPSHDSFIAETDGEIIRFSLSTLDFLRTDEELATVMGHEMAHATEKHMETRIAGGILGAVLDSVLILGSGGAYSADVFTQAGATAFSQAQETEADYVGLYMMARAGYNIENAQNLLRRMSLRSPENLKQDYKSSHPSNPKRFLTLRKTVDEIIRKQQYDLPLHPELKRNQ